MATWFGERYEGPDRPMESRRHKRTSWSEDLSDAARAMRGLGDMGASTLRGAVKGTLGLPGDIESLSKKGYGWLTGEKPAENALWTTEDVGKKSWMPPVNPGQKESPYEGVGEILGLPGAGSAALKAVKPAVEALRVTKRADTPALAAERRGLLKNTGAGAVTAGAAALGLGGTEAIVKALRGETKAEKVAGVAEKELPHWSRAGKSLHTRIAEKTQAYHDAEGLNLAENWGHPWKPHSPQDLAKQGREFFPGKSDNEILEIYERMLDADPAVYKAHGYTGTKELSPEEIEVMGAGRYDTRTGKYDQTEAELAKRIVSGDINPRDYKPGTFNHFDWWNSDYGDAHGALKGTVDESGPWQWPKGTGPNKGGASGSWSDAGGGDDAAKAMMLAASLREPATKRAKQLLDEGMHPHGVWRETGREVVPGTTDKFMKEISDAPAKLKEGPYKTPGKDGKLVPGWYRLDSILEHPELYKERPQYKDTLVVIGDAGNAQGSFNAELNRMTLSDTLLNKANAKDKMSVILHELQHPEQTRAGWPEGTNDNYMKFDDQQKGGLKLLKERGPHPQKRQELLDVIQALGGDPYQLYHKTWGEQQARTAEMRRFLKPEEQRMIPPSAMYDEPERGFDLKDFKKLKREAGYVYDVPVGPHKTGDTNHPTIIKNIKLFSDGKKSKWEELTDEEVDFFLELGLDEGLL